jgi:hypothetical protein
VFENKMLKKIFGHKWEDVNGKLRVLYRAIHNLMP